MVWVIQDGSNFPNSGGRTIFDHARPAATDDPTVPQPRPETDRRD
jgi:hypothetical protein